MYLFEHTFWTIQDKSGAFVDICAVFWDTGFGGVREGRWAVLDAGVPKCGRESVDRA